MSFPSLETLIISGNKNLINISTNAFKNLHNLKTLELFTNNLHTPSPLWFSDFTPEHLHSVAMYGNPWVCDCDMVPYWEWLHDGAGGLQPYTLSIICDEPVQLKGMRIEDISGDQLCPSTTTTENPYVVKETTAAAPATDYQFRTVLFGIILSFCFLSL